MKHYYLQGVSYFYAILESKCKGIYVVHLVCFELQVYMSSVNKAATLKVCIGLRLPNTPPNSQYHFQTVCQSYTNINSHKTSIFQH